MPKFGWKAVYEDGVIRQYPVGSPETNFKEVRDRGLPIRFFVGTKYGVNLANGELLIKGHWQRVGDLDGESHKPVKLVYFRRHTKIANADWSHFSFNVTGQSLYHFFGYEYRSERQVRINDVVQIIYLEGEVRVCIPDAGGEPTICFGPVSHHE